MNVGLMVLNVMVDRIAVSNKILVIISCIGGDDIIGRLNSTESTIISRCTNIHREPFRTLLEECEKIVEKKYLFVI